MCGATLSPHGATIAPRRPVPVRRVAGSPAAAVSCERPPPTDDGRQRERLTGIDVMRVVAAFGVVFLHFASRVVGTRELTAMPPAVQVAVHLRDFAIPFFVVISCFLLSRSLLGGAAGGPGLRQAISGRFWSLQVPCMFWSAVHVLALEALPTLLQGRLPAPNPFVIWFGWWHLWFLSFLFLASGAIVAAFSLFPRLRLHPRLAMAVSLTLAAVLAVSYRLPADVAPEIRRFANWPPLVPLGLALALLFVVRPGWFAWRRLGAAGLLLLATGLVGGAVGAGPDVRYGDRKSVV